MKLIDNRWYLLAIVLVFLSLCTDETEARRKVLRGRRVMTRQYKRGLAIPAWSIIVLVALSNLIIGGILYIVLWKVILTSSTVQSNSYTPAMMNDV